MISSSSPSNSSTSLTLLQQQQQQEKYHNWGKKHFSHPPYCFVCNNLICNIGKLALCCTNCHLTSHFECNLNFKTIPGFCSIVKHDWSKDRFNDSPMCSGCNNIIVSAKDKSSGYYCTKCLIKCHKNCRNLSSKCEPVSKSIFSIVKSSIDSSLNLGTLGNLGNLANISSSAITSSSSSSNLTVILSAGSSSHGGGLTATQIANKEKERYSIDVKNDGGSGCNQKDHICNSNCINNSSNSNPNSTPTSSTSSPTLNSPTHFTPLSPKQTSANSSNNNNNVTWTPPDNPTSMRPTSLTKSYDPQTISSMMGKNNVSPTGSISLSNSLLPLPSSMQQPSQQHQQQDTLSELDGISFNVVTATINQKLLFVERMKSFFVGLSMKMDPSFDLSSPCRTNSGGAGGGGAGIFSHCVVTEDLLTSPKFRSIAHIFHHDMLNYGKSRTQAQIDLYRRHVDLFLQIYSTTSWEEENDFILRLALNFYAFLNSHKKDPENILMGMNPSKDIQRRVKKYFYLSDQGKTSQQQQQQQLHPRDLNSSTSSNGSNGGSGSSTSSSNLSSTINLTSSMSLMSMNGGGQFTSNSNLNMLRATTVGTSSGALLSGGVTSKRHELRISRLTLIDYITSWAQIEDKEMLARAIKEFSGEIEKEKMVQGDIVIVKVPKNWSPLRMDSIIDPNHHEFDEGTFLFARYCREADVLGINCYVYLKPDETNAICIPHSRVVPLSMLGITLPSDRSKLERLITNPFDAFSTELRQAVKDTTKDKLRDLGLDPDIINQSLNFNGVRCISLDELTTLKAQLCAFDGKESFLSQIDFFSSNFSQFFANYLKKVYLNESRGNHQLYFTRDQTFNDYTLPSIIIEYNNSYGTDNPNNNNSSHIVTEEEFIKQNQQQKDIQNKNNSNKENSHCTTKYFSMIKRQYTKFKPFLPTLRALIGDLENGRIMCLRAKDSLQGLISECDLAIDTVNTDNLRLLDGSKKKELTTWWLQIIGSSVSSYLTDRGFDPSAVPDNYIDERPASLSMVKENLRIVNLVLKPSTQYDIEHRLNYLTLPLKIKIYHRIDQFLLSAEILLFDRLKRNKKLLEEIIINGINNSNNKEQSSQQPDQSTKTTPTPKVADIDIISRDELEVYFDFKKLLSYFKSKIQSDSIPPSELQIINIWYNLIEDILYIREMKNLEEHFYNNDVLLEVSHPITNEKFTLSNIVPITGLVFSRLLRIKHELRTVLEVHGEKQISTRSLFPNVVHHGVIIGKKDDKGSGFSGGNDKD